MNHTVIDTNNPHWDGLHSHVQTLQDKLLELASFYLRKEVIRPLTDNSLDDPLSKAALNISRACLDVTDATCTVVATMHSILKKQTADAMNINSAVSGELSVGKHEREAGIDGWVSMLSMLEMILSKVKEKSKPECKELESLQEVESLLEVAAAKIEDIHQQISSNDCTKKRKTFKDAKKKDQKKYI